MAGASKMGPNFAGNGIPTLENCKAVKTSGPGVVYTHKTVRKRSVTPPAQKGFAKKGAIHTGPRANVNLANRPTISREVDRFR
jgi:hypothetical protein